MARSPSQAVEHVADLLSCTVCMEEFDEGSKQAKLLPCHHSFCMACLLMLASATPSQNVIDCPTCRSRTRLTSPAPTGIESLQTNFYVNPMRQLLGDPRLKTKLCRKHGNSKLTKFCTSCEIQICDDCYICDHLEEQGHIVQELSEAVHEQKYDLQLYINEALESMISYDQILNKLECESQNLYASKIQADDDINKTFDTFIEALNSRRQKLLVDLSEVYVEKLDTLDTRTSSLSKQKTSLEGLVEECQEAMESENISDLLAYKAKLSKKNKELRSAKPKTTFGNNYIKFRLKDKKTMSASIKSLGAIKKPEPLPAVVTCKEQRATAGLFTSLTLEVKSAAGQALENYPITVDILDPADDKIPNIIQHKKNGLYEVTFRPQIGGLHLVIAKFLNRKIHNGVYNLNVFSNNPIMRIGGKGMGVGEMGYPRALAVDARNDIYVVDTGNNRIQKYNRNGEVLFDFLIDDGGENFSSCGLAINSEDGILICPEVCMEEADLAFAHTLLIYSLEGHLLKRVCFRDVLQKALSVAVNSEGHFIIADFEFNCIMEFDKYGRLVNRFGEEGSEPGQFKHPTFVAVGENNSIIVSDGDNHRIQVFDKMGTFLYMFGERGSKKGQFNMPFGVACDNHGNILVVDGGNKRIQVFKEGGDFVCTIDSLADKLNAPRGIAVSSDGHVLVADRDNHCVKKFKYLHCTPV